MALVDSLSGHHLLSLSDAMKVFLKVIYVSSSFTWYQQFNKLQSSYLLLEGGKDEKKKL